jgi:predicted glycosyltransferase
MSSYSNNNPTVLIHCQYVYGIGHLVRATELAQGLSTSFTVYLLNGGEEVPNFDIPKEVNYIQLPAIYKEEAANYLSPVDSSQSIEACFESRKKEINEIVEKIEPDFLITEHFPFGLLFETEVLRLISKVKEIKPKAKIISSVRDVIESENGGERDAYVCDLLNKLYDLVLVHGDKEIIPFSGSFPLAERISIPVHLTGYIVRPITSSIKKADLPILVVSVGGGRMGSELLSAVINAHPIILKEWDHELVLFTGAFQKELSELHTEVSEYCDSKITIYEFDKNLYLKTLSNASAIICLGGYNSLIEAVSTQKPVLVYKRKFHGANSEQDLRSTLFKQAGFINIISAEDFEEERLTSLIIDTIYNYSAPKKRINFQGVASSTSLIKALTR